MNKIDHLAESHAKLKNELTRVDNFLRKISPDVHLGMLQDQLDKAIDSGNQNSIDDAVEALAAAKAGTDEISKGRARMESQRRVKAIQLREIEKEIESTKRIEADLRVRIAGELLAEARADYEFHARELLEIFPRLSARSFLATEARRQAGLSVNTPIFASFYSASLPLAGGCGLPPELAGGTSHHAKEFMSETEAAKVLLESRFQAERPKGESQTSADAA